MELKDRGLDAPAIAAGLVRDGDLDKKEARREAKACVAVASLDDDKARVSSWVKSSPRPPTTRR